ncbi:MAG: hypothetical protein U0361_15455 [Nitrospiraceae bacterium]
MQEYLQGVTVIDRRIDEEAKTCSATAVMLKHRLSQADPGSLIELLRRISCLASC